MSEERRRFRLSDAIVLVAAVALMLSADRAVHGFWVWGDPVASYGPAETSPHGVVVRPRGPSASRSSARSWPAGRTGAACTSARPASSSIWPSGWSWRCGSPDWAAQASIFALFEGRPGFYATRWTVEVLNYLGNDLRKDVVIAVLATWLALAVVGRWNPRTGLG